MKVGLFGGSFNPIHNFHVKIIEEVLRQGLVDEAWIIPCYSHSFGKELVSFKNRVEMIRLAFKDVDNVKICEIEKEIGGISKTYNTVVELKKGFNHEFFWICGGDCVWEFRKWYRSKDLADEIKFIVYVREGVGPNPNSLMRVEKVLDRYLDDISSSQIRKSIKNNEDVSNLLPELVSEYLNKMGLYKN